MYYRCTIYGFNTLKTIKDVQVDSFVSDKPQNSFSCNQGHLYLLNELHGGRAKVHVSSDIFPVNTIISVPK